MNRRIPTTLAAAAMLAGGGFAPLSTALAQARYSESLDGLADYYLYGPPDIPGCPRDCARDFSPCDPPAFKRADNRCTNRTQGGRH